ncbi:HEAT repeat domain-containing protein, partial [bacterium]|nr:HEAT repeat domain-containing protein [bacterium]
VPWTFSGADSLTHDLLCGIQAQVTIPELGTVTRTGELLLLRAPPPVSISLPKTFYRPSEPITASFIGSVAPQDTDTLPVTCTLSHEGRDGETGEQVLAISAEALASRRLVLQASRPGRYVLRLQSRGAPSEAVFWVVDGAGDLHWDGAQAPLLVAERGWMRAGESMSAVVAAPAGAPLALTFRSGSRVRRETVPLLTGARTLTLQADDYPTDPVHVTLVQMTPDGARKGRGAIGIEPGGQTLEVRPKLLYVRTGDTPLRGFGINTHDRLGQPVQSIVGLELVRPSFLGTPPVAVHRNTLQWHHGRATSVDGAMEVAYNPALLARSYGLFIEALAPDGRSGTHMMPTQDPAAGPVGEKAPPPSPAEKFAAISARGLSSPVVRWLAALLVQRHPTLAERLPDLAAGVASSEDAVVLVQLAEGSPASLRATLRALAARRDSTAAAALGAASRHAAALRPIFEQALASHPFPATRSQAATALAHALPASHGALAAALLTDSSAQVRAAAAHALASGGPASVHALTEAAAQEQDGTVLLAIAESLGVHGNVEAARALLQLASRRQPALVIAAVQALDAIGYKGAHPRILRILRSGPLAARPVAARLLLRSDDTAARDAVLSAVERKPTGALMAALAQTHGSDVDALARRWLKHADPAVRLAAAERFIADEPLLAKPVLRALLDASQPAAVADRAAQLLITSRDDASILKIMALADAGRLTRPTTLALIRTAAALGWQDTGRLLV